MGVPISNVTRRVVYAASGTGPYNFSFEILANTDIAVYRDDTLLTLTTDYTVTINPNGTGYVTLVATPTGATQIAIVGNRTISRSTDFTTGGDFFANTLNDELDQLTIFAQQNAEGINRALQAPQTDPTSINMTLPRSSERANKYLGFDVNGNPIATAGTSEPAGLGTMSTQNANNVAISGGIIAGITDLAVADGGTGASTAANARTNLGLGTIATQNANNVAITGGTIDNVAVGGTTTVPTANISGQLTIANGGTGASTADNAKINLGVITGTTGSARLPSGTTGQRDGAPSAGFIRFNSTISQFEGYNGSAWSSVGGGATGGGADQVFVENGQTITANYTLTTNKNAMSTGPITINSGITVTVPSGARWVVL